MENNNNIPLFTDDFHLEVPETISTQKAWSKIEGKLIENTTANKIYLLKPLLSIAASVLLLFGAYYYFGYFTTIKKTIFSTHLSEIHEFYLPDSSTVILNAESTLEINPENWTKNKIVKLEGEAFFKVTKGSRFIVKTPLGEVQVMGTQFNVYSRKNYFTVSCTEGAVKVVSENKNVILRPGEQTKRKSNGDLNLFENSNYFACWTENKFCFEEESLHNVLDELARRFSYTIDYSNAKNITYSGNFNANSIEEALVFICEPLELKYLKQNNVIYIKSKSYVKSN
jgi:transmembrane sensor